MTANRARQLMVARAFMALGIWLTWFGFINLVELPPRVCGATGWLAGWFAALAWHWESIRGPR